MASDQELRTLIKTFVTDQRAARRVMAGMTMAISELASEQSLDISDEQAKDVARSLLGSRLVVSFPSYSPVIMFIKIIN